MNLSLAFCISAVVWVQSFSERYSVSWNPTDSSYEDWRKTCRRLSICCKDNECISQRSQQKAPAFCNMRFLLLIRPTLILGIHARDCGRSEGKRSRYQNSLKHTVLSKNNTVSFKIMH